MIVVAIPKFMPNSATITELPIALLAIHYRFVFSRILGDDRVAIDRLLLHHLDLHGFAALSLDAMLDRIQDCIHSRPWCKPRLRAFPENARPDKD